jgi:hypothetical protein
METGDASISSGAGIPGTIVQIIPNRERSSVPWGLIQGTWGNGRIETGTLYNLTENPADAHRFRLTSACAAHHSGRAHP